ncbi:MAG: hypothetical protein KTV68_19090, partial [Acidimicrobiia bacterium]|nr:hypothetical protein [Acidimicrobiia bacterium]
MSETLRELIDSAEASGGWDAVADWCERFDCAQAEGHPAAEFYLESAVVELRGGSHVEAPAVEGASGQGRERVDDRLDFKDAVAPACAALHEDPLAHKQIDAAPRRAGSTASSSAALAALRTGFEGRASMSRITELERPTPP